MADALVIHGDCLDVMMAIARGEHIGRNSVDLVIGSPPYAEKGERYGRSKKWPTDDWIEWMLHVTVAATRVATNTVVWVVNGAVKDGAYLPACEGLVYRAYQNGLICERPCIWHKNAPPSRKDWFGNDWEYCLVFRPQNSSRYFNWEAIAEPPKYSAGGRFRQRTASGERRLGNEYPQNKLARPRDVFRVTVGGGHLGSKLAHENEAPYPEGIVEPFVKVLCPPGGTVLDPFSGSGTTIAVASKLGRKCIAIDVRESQVDLTKRRIAEVQESMAS
jgi:site-specific DNA-methyltransferase (adenine-specific)